MCVAYDDLVHFYVISAHYALLGTTAGGTTLPGLWIPFVEAPDTTAEKRRQP